jgi:hypothetical protein
MNTRGIQNVKNNRWTTLHTWMKTLFNLLLVLGLTAFAAEAQDEVPPPMPAEQTFTDPQLQQLLGPIALYPDPLIAVMLPAATLPTEIVMADRYVSGGGDINEIDQQPWDPNVQALAHYPAVLKWMDDNLNWTTQLGEAFQNQQPDVMTAVQELRTDAYNMGNLQSTAQQQVINDNGYIEILPANPDDVYVPQYQPAQVYYNQPVGAPFVVFSVGYAIGPWLCGDFDWRNHHVIFWNRDHPRPSGWWQKRPEERSAYFAGGHAPVWNGQNRRPYERANQGDRGYNNNLPWTAPGGNSQGREQHPQAQRPPGQPQHPQPQQNLQPQHLAPQHLEPQHIENNQAPNNAFIGIQSTHDTRDYSNRGENSMKTMPQFRDLGGFHGGNAPPTPAPSGGFHGGSHGGAPAGGGSRQSPPSGGGGGNGRH